MGNTQIDVTTTKALEKTYKRHYGSAIDNLLEIQNEIPELSLDDLAGAALFFTPKVIDLYEIVREYALSQGRYMEVFQQAYECKQNFPCNFRFFKLDDALVVVSRDIMPAQLTDIHQRVKTGKLEEYAQTATLSGCNKVYLIMEAETTLLYGNPVSFERKLAQE
ncbi:MAG: hypothetical protein V1859_01095 [archaeon]